MTVFLKRTGYRENQHISYFLISNILGIKKATRYEPFFIPSAAIRNLRDLVRYHFKLTCMINCEKDCAHNCLTVSNLKLDNVFSGILGKSSHSIYRTYFTTPRQETFYVKYFS